MPYISHGGFGICRDQRAFCAICGGGRGGVGWGGVGWGGVESDVRIADSGTNLCYLINILQYTAWTKHLSPADCVSVYAFGLCPQTLTPWNPLEDFCPPDLLCPPYLQMLTMLLRLCDPIWQVIMPRCFEMTCSGEF